MNTAERSISGPDAIRSTRWIADSNAVGCEIEGEMVLLDLQTGTYFGLNRVGAEIWNQLREGKTAGEIQTYLLSQYSVAPERCEAEVLALLTELRDRGLVKSANEAAA